MDSKRSIKSSESHDGEKKKSKGGFLNLIKRSSKSDKSDKSDKSEKNQVTPPSSATSNASLASASSIAEEPSSPKPTVKSPAPEPKSRDSSNRSQPADYSSSSDRSEELRTPDSIDEPWESSDGRGSPQGGRRYPAMQIMGSGLLAEMKAKQERRAHKSSSPDRPDSNSTGSLEKTAARVETKPDPAPRARVPSSSSSSGGPVSPKPLMPQGAKPALSARPSLPHKPRTASSRSIDENLDAPNGEGLSPKATASSLKKALPEKDKEAHNSLQPGSSANKSTQEGRKAPGSESCQRSSHQRTNSNDHAPFKTKGPSTKSDKDKTGKESTDPEKDADKEMILI